MRDGRRERMRVHALSILQIETRLPPKSSFNPIFCSLLFSMPVSHITSDIGSDHGTHEESASFVFSHMRHRMSRVSVCTPATDTQSVWVRVITQLMHIHARSERHTRKDEEIKRKRTRRSRHIVHACESSVTFG